MRLLAVLSATLFFAQAAWAAGAPSSCVVTIENIQLKTSEGRWLTVIDPDHPVDIVKEEPGLSFFNNGRVPAGRYSNFKLTLSDDVKALDAEHRRCQVLGTKTGHDGIQIMASKDLDRPLVVQKGSFVAVWFTLDLTHTVEGLRFTVPEKVSALTMTVDGDTRNLGTDEVRVEL